MIVVKNGKILIPKNQSTILNIFIAPQQIVGISKEIDFSDYVIIDGIRIPRRFKLIGRDEDNWVNVSTKIERFGVDEEVIWFVDAPDLIELATDPAGAIRKEANAFVLGELAKLFAELRKLVARGELTIERWSVLRTVENVKIWGMDVGPGTYSGIPSGYVDELTDDSKLEGYVVTDIIPTSRI